MNQLDGKGEHMASIELKEQHAYLNKQTDKLEKARQGIRSYTSWIELKNLKKLKLKIKDKLNAVK